MALLKLSLFAAATVAVGVSFRDGQQPLGPALTAPAPSTEAFTCDLPPAVDPAGDGLPSADELFSSEEALKKQVERHQAVVRVPSICFDDLGDVDEDPRYAVFYDFHDVLAETYPVIHERAKLEKIHKFGLLYTIEGSDSSLKPAMLTAHQDVVPVADESTWTYPPFDAYFDGEWLWGRGSSDDKNSMTALLSATETLLSDPDYTPKRTLLIAFGFDEECSGYKGAGHIGKHLTEKYGDNGLAIVLDEGGLGMMPYDDIVFALPGVLEKGHVDIWYELRVQGGHSSVPLPHTGIGIMSEIVSTLESNPYTPEVIKGSAVYKHLTCMGRYAPDLLPGLPDLLKDDDLEGLAEVLGMMDARALFLVQTSQAVDIISAGVKINAMPEVVTLGVNYRVAPQDSVPIVQHRSVKLLKDVVAKYNLSVNAYEGDEAYALYVASQGLEEAPVEPLGDVDYHGSLSITTKQVSHVAPTSPTDGAVWDIFSGTIQHSFSKYGKLVPVGEIMTGNTDTRHYLNLTPNVYRWSPGMNGAAVNAHTVDEGVSMIHHMDMVKFYYDFIRNFDAASDF